MGIGNQHAQLTDDLRLLLWRERQPLGYEPLFHAQRVSHHASPSTLRAVRSICCESMPPRESSSDVTRVPCRPPPSSRGSTPLLRYQPSFCSHCSLYDGRLSRPRCSQKT